MGEVTGTTFKRWREEPDFPQPIVELSIGPVWLADDLLEWFESRMSQRERKAAVRDSAREKAIRLYRQLGNVSETARHLNMNRVTLTLWLQEAGEPLPRERSHAA